MVKFDDGRSVRVRSLGPHTTMGDPGLITRQVRSATIEAELDSVLYALSFEAYERLKSENRPLHQALLSYVVTVMAERLGFAKQGGRRAAPLTLISAGNPHPSCASACFRLTPHPMSGKHAQQ